MGLLPRLRKDLGEVFHVSLACWCLLVQLLTLGGSLFNLAQVLNVKYMWWTDDGNKGYLGPEDATMILFISFLLLIDLCGLLGILIRWKFGLRVVGIGFRIVLVSFAVTLITTLLVWFFTICGVGGGNAQMIGKYIYDDMIMLSIEVLTVLLAWHTLSGIKSLQYVVVYGGTGWEKLNYIDMKNMRRTEAFIDIIQ